MSTPARNSRATVIPCLRYRDAPAAIDWLCAAFGFEKQAAHHELGRAEELLYIEVPTVFGFQSDEQSAGNHGAPLRCMLT